MGHVKVSLADASDSFYRKVFCVTSAAEAPDGGSYSAINMYDSGGVSVGAIQCTEFGSFKVTNMIGRVAERCGLDHVLGCLEPLRRLIEVDFKKNSNQQWRFYLDGQEVNTTSKQKLLFYGDTFGNEKGTFTDKKKELAKTWAACLASLWEHPEAVLAQIDYTIPLLEREFTYGLLKVDLFTDVNLSEEGWLGATRAILVSFAVNSPNTVSKRYASSRINQYSIGTREWCLTVLKSVVYNGLNVWPKRWESIRPVVSRMFGIDIGPYSDLAKKVEIRPQLPESVEAIRDRQVQEEKIASTEENIRREKNTNKELATGSNFIIFVMRLISYVLAWFRP